MTRRLRLLASGCALLVLLIAAPAARAAQLFGFNDSWLPDRVEATVQLTQQLHANSERYQIYWGSVEPQPGAYDWSSLDTVYGVMLSHGIRPLFDPVSAPSWATAPGCNDVVRCQQSPAHDGDFAAFVRALVARYPQAVGVEIGNEPNLTNWSMHPDPARYAQILKVGYAAVKQANPSMPVITGATCCTTAGGANIPATTFLGDLYNDGIKGHYDFLGFHLYPGGPVSRVAPDLKLEMSRMRAVRDSHGDNKQFWITETGFPSAGVSAYGGGVFDEYNQAQREAIDYRVVSAMPDVYALYFYRLTDPTSGMGANMGLYHSDLTPKPAVQALLDAFNAPPWPTFSFAAQGPGRVRSGQRFQLRIAGNLPTGVQFQWMIWRGTWVGFGPGSGQRSAIKSIWHPGTYLLAAQMTTDLDTYLSTPIKVRIVLHMNGASHPRAHHHRRKH